MTSPLCANCGYTVVNDIEIPTTPVPDLLGGHNVPSTSQAHTIYDTISAVQGDISRFDCEITRLQAVLDDLLHKRNSFREYAKLHMALIAPVRRLPPEVLSEIFLQCKEFDTQFGCTVQSRLDKAPLLLGSVCSRWRTIALSTPRLWASFALTIRPKYLKSDVMLAKTWLDRAGICPLSISLSSQVRYENNMKRLIQVFLLHCERWYEVQLFSLPEPVIRTLWSAEDRLPRLQKLSIDGLSGTINLFDNLFESVPQLRCFYLHSPDEPSGIKIPWSQLRYFRMGHCGVDSCVKLLRLTPNLEECVLSLSGLTPSAPHTPIQLLHLRRLTIRGDPVHLLDKLVVPKLHNISIYQSCSSWTATKQLTSILSRCSVEYLSFSSLRAPLRDIEMIEILQTCSSLVQLDLGHCSSQVMTKAFLAHFTYQQDSETSNMAVLVPMLHTITVDYVPLYFDMLAFIHVIESRMMLDGASEGKSVARLKTVEICNSHEKVIDPTILSRLRQLRDVGLKISVLCRGKDCL